MICGVLASASASTHALSSPFFKPRSSSFFSASSSSSGKVHTDLKLKSVGLYGRKGSRGSIFHCSSSVGPGRPGFGEGDSRSVLDAFFLGKALAEAINERIESGVGEFFSTTGRLQAEQQKQVEEFQEDVLERAKKAKERAAHETAEAQGIMTSTTEDITPVIINKDFTAVSSTTTTTILTLVNQSSTEPAPSPTKSTSTRSGIGWHTAKKMARHLREALQPSRLLGTQPKLVSRVAQN